MNFTYDARHPNGDLTDGTVSADSLDEAALKLRREGLYIVSLRPVDAAAGGGFWESGPFKPRVSRTDIIYFARQLAVLIDTGVTLSTALQGIQEQATNPTFKSVLADLRDEVEGGEDFSKALERHPKYFDQIFVQLIRAGESSGSMSEMLDRVSSYLCKEAETRSKVKAAMAYPLVMLVMAIGVTIFLLAYIFPKFTPLFEARELDLPGPTRLMMGISHVLTNYWYLVVGGVVVLAVAFVMLVRSGPGRAALDFAKIHAPLIGQMFRKASITRSLRTMATMINSGVPVLEAIELSGRVSGNVHYNHLWDEICDHVVGGQQICEAISNRPLIPNVLVQMVHAGEQTGKLGPVLLRVSDFYDQELDTTVKAVTSLIEPIMVAVMGVVIGTVAMSLLLPIFTLSRNVR